jgi:hypothetical protein
MKEEIIVHKGGNFMLLKKRGTVLFIIGIFVFLFLFGSKGLFSDKKEEGLFQDLVWRNIGPANMGGRISDIQALNDDYRFVICASASGGVWKTTNAGTTWEPIFDKYGSASIGAVAVFQKDRDLIWVGTGESNTRNSVGWGDGIYKSIDGGESFQNMGLRDSHHIARIITHPTDPDVVYAAAQGHLWGHTGERGLFKTVDGGKTWMNLAGGLPQDGKTGCTDVKIDPRVILTFCTALSGRDCGGPTGLTAEARTEEYLSPRTGETRGKSLPQAFPMETSAESASPYTSKIRKLSWLLWSTVFNPGRGAKNMRT